MLNPCLTHMNRKKSASLPRRNSSHRYSPPTGRSVRQPVSAAAWKRTIRGRTNQQPSADLDLKEAAQIVYDAVWSDPSDPRKTYQNAAQALLTELCERS